MSPYSPGNLITTMVYALGILSLVNLLLGLIPAAEEKAAARAIEEVEDMVNKAIEDGEELDDKM